MQRQILLLIIAALFGTILIANLVILAVLLFDPNNALRNPMDYIWWLLALIAISYFWVKAVKSSKRSSRG